MAAGCINGASAAERWGLVRISVANVREKPSHAAEMGTQVVMGTPLKLWEKSDGWWRVETPDGYKGYVIDNSLTVKTQDELDGWKRAQRVVVTSSDQTYVYDGDADRRVTDVVNGSLLEVDGDEMGIDVVAVRLPDGRRGVIASDEVMEVKRWASRECDKNGVVRFTENLMGVPYLWGGTSSKSMDCSGLSKIAYLSEGIILPRNASAQAKVGVKVDSWRNLKAGDLIFFGNRETGRVNHVGIYISDGRYIHSSGRVRVSSLNREDVDYEETDVIVMRRLSDSDLEKMSVKNNSWYF